MGMAVGDLDVPFVSIDPTRRGDGGVDPQAWLHRNEVGYAVTAYEDVLAVLGDPRWHSGLHLLGSGDTELDRYFAEKQKNILALDGPGHDRLRRVLARHLTPRSIERLRPAIAATAGDVIVPVVERGHGEFIAEVCAPFAVRIVIDLLGLGDEWLDRFESVTADPADRAQWTSSETIAAMERLDAFAREVLDHRHREATPGLLSVLCAAETDGTLAPDEAVVQVLSLLLAGIGSTRSQLGLAAWLFARFDAQYQLLRRRPELAPMAIEEVLRYRPAARGTARIASADIEYRGVRFPEGTLLLLAIAIANRDPAVVDDPGTFDIARTPKRHHLTFGHGVHFCIGAALARAALREALMVLGDASARLEIAGDVEWLPPTTDFWGPASLVLQFA